MQGISKSWKSIVAANQEMAPSNSNEFTSNDYSQHQEAEIKYYSQSSHIHAPNGARPLYIGLPIDSCKSQFKEFRQPFRNSHYRAQSTESKSKWNASKMLYSYTPHYPHEIENGTCVGNQCRTINACHTLPHHGYSNSNQVNRSRHNASSKATLFTPSNFYSNRFPCHSNFRKHPEKLAQQTSFQSHHFHDVGQSSDYAQTAFKSDSIYASNKENKRQNLLSCCNPSSHSYYFNHETHMQEHYNHNQRNEYNGGRNCHKSRISKTLQPYYSKTLQPLFKPCGCLTSLPSHEDLLIQILTDLYCEEITPSYEEIRRKLEKQRPCETVSTRFVDICRDDPKQNFKVIESLKDIHIYLTSEPDHFLGFIDPNSNEFPFSPNLICVLFFHLIDRYRLDPIGDAYKGGRFLLAELLKVDGPYALRTLSQGKLCHLLQKCLDIGVLSYENNSIRPAVACSALCKAYSARNCIAMEPEKLERQKEDMKLIRSRIKTFLDENPSGFAMCRLPVMYKQEFDTVLDIESLGYKKLAEFLQKQASDICVIKPAAKHRCLVLPRDKNAEAQETNDNENAYYILPDGQVHLKDNLMSSLVRTLRMHKWIRFSSLYSWQLQTFCDIEAQEYINSDNFLHICSIWNDIKKFGNITPVKLNTTEGFLPSISDVEECIMESLVCIDEVTSILKAANCEPESIQKDQFLSVITENIGSCLDSDLPHIDADLLRQMTVCYLVGWMRPLALVLQKQGISNSLIHSSGTPSTCDPNYSCSGSSMYGVDTLSRSTDKGYTEYYQKIASSRIFSLCPYLMPPENSVVPTEKDQFRSFMLSVSYELGSDQQPVADKSEMTPLSLNQLRLENPVCANVCDWIFNESESSTSALRDLTWGQDQIYMDSVDYTTWTAPDVDEHREIQLLNFSQSTTDCLCSDTLHQNVAEASSAVTSKTASSSLNIGAFDGSYGLQNPFNLGSNKCHAEHRRYELPPNSNAMFSDQNKLTDDLTCFHNSFNHVLNTQDIIENKTLIRSTDSEFTKKSIVEDSFISDFFYFKNDEMPLEFSLGASDPSIVNTLNIHDPETYKQIITAPDFL